MSLSGLLQMRGVPVTFSSAARSLDEASGRTTTVDTTVVGSARRIRGDVKEYEALGLTEKENITLLFTPTTRGQSPALGSSVTFGALPFVVEKVDPSAPAGVVESARVIASR